METNTQYRFHITRHVEILRWEDLGLDIPNELPPSYEEARATSDGHRAVMSWHNVQRRRDSDRNQSCSSAPKETLVSCIASLFIMVSKLREKPTLSIL